MRSDRKSSLCALIVAGLVTARVAVITDVDIPPDEEDGATPGDKVRLAQAIADKTAKYEGQCVKSFIAPQWTLE